MIRKARRHAYLTLFVIVLLLTCSCRSMQSFEAGIKTPSWFPLEILVKVKMKVAGEVDLSGGDEEETEVAEGVDE